MHERHGDLLQLALAGEFDVIVHGCNCFGDMGKGIALAVKQQFPEAYQADLATAKQKVIVQSWGRLVRRWCSAVAAFLWW